VAGSPIRAHRKTKRAPEKPFRDSALEAHWMFKRTRPAKPRIISGPAG
jgi:hypothetical protein